MVYKFTEPFPQHLIGVSGIYELRNIVSGKFYIGSATTVYKRFYRHRAELRARTHRNAHLQRSFDKHGDRAFVGRILELCPRDELLEKEQVHVTAHRDDPSCYNIVRSAIRRPGDTFSDETKEKMRIGMIKYWANPEARKNASLKHMGKKNTPEHIAKTVAVHVLPFDLTSPSGVRHQGVNMAEFCRKNNLSPSHMVAVQRHERYSCKGWVPTIRPPGIRFKRRCVLTEELVVKIRNEHAAGGISYEALGRKHGVNGGTIELAVKRRTWKHVQ